MSDEATRLRTLEQRLQRLEDVEAIRQLKAEYGELVDRRYEKGRPVSGRVLEELADRIAALFTADAIWDGGSALGLCRGRDAIRQRFAEPTLNFSWHFFVKPRIQVDGDQATARWDILAPCTSRDDRALWMAGVEDDSYQRVDGSWLHSRMALTVVFMAPYERGWVKRDARG